MLPKLPSGSGHVLHDGDMIGYMFQPDDLIKDAEFLLANGFRVSCYWEDHGSFHEPIVYFYLVVGEYVDYKCKGHPFKRLHQLSKPTVLFPSMTLDEVRSKVHEARKRISDLFKVSRKHSY